MCIPIAQCQYLNELANTRPPPPNAEGFIRAHYCNESEVIIVCCALEAINKDSVKPDSSPNVESSTNTVTQLEDKLIETTNRFQDNNNGDTNTRFQFPNFNNLFGQFQFPAFNAFPGFVPNNFGAFGNPFNFYTRQYPTQPYSSYPAPNQGYNQGYNQAPTQGYNQVPNQGYNQGYNQAPINQGQGNQGQNQQTKQTPVALGGGDDVNSPSCGTEVVGNRILAGEVSFF